MLLEILIVRNININFYLYLLSFNESSDEYLFLFEITRFIETITGFVEYYEYSFYQLKRNYL